MSIVYTEVTLRNAFDVEIEAAGLIKDHKIRETTVNAVVDTGAWTIVINGRNQNYSRFKKIKD